MSGAAPHPPTDGVEPRPPTGGAAPRPLLVSAEYPPTPGGVGDYTARLAAALAAAGARPAVLTGRRQVNDEPAALDPGGPSVWYLAPGWGWRMPPVVEAAAAEWGADLVHIQYQAGAYRMHPAINLLPRWLRRRRQRPAIAVTFHDLRPPYLFPKAGRLRAALLGRLAGDADLTIATNPADAAWLAPRARRLALIPIGANIEPGPETEALAGGLRAGLDLRPDERLLVTFGLLNHSKGLPTLLRALARLNGQSAVGRYRLALVGAGDAGLDPTDQATAGGLRALADELGLAAALIWTGPLPAATVAAWLRAADAVALPYVDGASYRRGTLLAALACGAAVVTTTPAPDHADTAALDHAAAAGGLDAPPLPPLRSALQVMLVPPEDPAALALALAAVAGDDGLRRALRRGAEELAAHFAWPGIARRTLAAYAALAPCPS